MLESVPAALWDPRQLQRRPAEAGEGLPAAVLQAWPEQARPEQAGPELAGPEPAALETVPPMRRPPQQAQNSVNSQPHPCLKPLTPLHRSLALPLNRLRYSAPRPPPRFARSLRA